MKRLFTAALIATIGLLSGCSIVSVDEPERRSAGPDVVTQALKDVERFWTAEFGAIAGGKKFTPVQGGYFPYSQSDPPPACGGQRSSYEPNAFYCPPDDFIAWDAQQLIPELQEDFGPLLVGVVMAHEYGHAIQGRVGPSNQPTVVLEQQADCYAGAWLADVLAGRSTAFKDVTPSQLDDSVAGMLQLRDQPGTPALAEGAHGNAFDRIRALQDGVDEGVATCAKAWPDLAIQPFRAGDPPACPKPDASAEGAAFYCPDGDFVAFDSTDLGPALHDRIGDFAIGMLLGDLFARAAQDRRGEATRTEQGQLTVDCLAGSWTNDLLTRDANSRVRLSPGDLDEAVSALLAFGRASDNTGPTAFDRIAAYREGVLKGLPACTN